MPKVTELKVGISRLVAGPVGLLKKFENITFDCQLTISIDASDNLDEVYDHAMKRIRSKLNQEMDRLEGIQVSTPIEEDYIPEPGFNIHETKEK